MTRRNRERLTSTTRQLGETGETAAADYLVKRGYIVVARNWRCEAGEVDLIVRQGEMLIFVEVKSVTRAKTEDAALKVNRAKQRRLVRCLYTYLDIHHLGDVETRVDVIAIAFTPSGPIIEHREDILEFDLFSGDDA
jgi:putative endonuclease